jgi:CRISPR-associated protein Cas2
MYVILVYDIANQDSKGQRVWRNVFNTCKKFLHHIQKSVFEGEISESGLVKLQTTLKTLIREDEDTIIIFKSSTQKWLKKEMIGLQKDEADNFI